MLNETKFYLQCEPNFILVLCVCVRVRMCMIRVHAYAFVVSGRIFRSNVNSASFGVVRLPGHNLAFGIFCLFL